MSSTYLHEAIAFLGGQTSAAEVLERRQATISGYLKEGSVPLEVAARIQMATKGKFRADKLRPDLADIFAELRKPLRRKAA